MSDPYEHAYVVRWLTEPRDHGGQMVRYPLFEPKTHGEKGRERYEKEFTNFLKPILKPLDKDAWMLGHDHNLGASTVLIIAGTPLLKAFVLGLKSDNVSVRTLHEVNAAKAKAGRKRYLSALPARIEGLERDLEKARREMAELMLEFPGFTP